MLTPLQVRDAIVEWATRNMSFPPGWDCLDMANGTLKLNVDGSASLKMVRDEKPAVQP